MKKRRNAFGAVAICCFAALASFAIYRILTGTPTIEVGSQPLAGAAYDGESLFLDFGNERIVIDVDESAPDQQTVRLVDRGSHVTRGTVRYFSRAFYKSHGQPGGGTFVYSDRIAPENIVSDPTNEFADSFPIADGATETDLSFLSAVTLLGQRNRIGSSAARL